MGARRTVSLIVVAGRATVIPGPQGRPVRGSGEAL